MITWLKRIFIDNWPRKVVSLVLGMIIWVVVNHSLTSQKTFSEVPVKVINIPSGKTIEGLQPNGILQKRITLSLTGNSNLMGSLNSSDLEVIIDAEGKGSEWIADISKKNIISLNKDIDLSKGITKISNKDFIIKLTKFVTERIPILVTKPIGEAPAGYQFLDIWPYHLYITVSGPEPIVKDLKTKGLKLTFNLNDISKTELNSLQSTKQKDEISFYVPASWKRINISAISNSPLEIDDPQAKALRIDFSMTDLIPINAPIPVSVFYPVKYSKTLNPETCKIETNDFIQNKNGIKMITQPLLAKGVSRLFLDIVKDMIQIVVIAAPKSERDTLFWNMQFVYPHELENLYVAKTLSESSENDMKGLHQQHQEEYLRNRFRGYMNRFRLYTPNDEKLYLKIELINNNIVITPQSKTE